MNLKALSLLRTGLPVLASQANAGSLPPLSQQLTWVSATESVTIEELSSQLSVDQTRLARLNNVDEDHRSDKGEWIALPSRDLSALTQIASIDASSARTIQPQQVQRIPLTSSGVIRFGDTIVEIARRYGLSIAELLRLNPGLETARLAVGSQVRLAQSAPLPAIRPSRPIWLSPCWSLCVQALLQIATPQCMTKRHR